MADFPGDYDELQENVLAAKVLIENDLIPAMTESLTHAGAPHNYRFVLTDDAIGMFRRRYRMALTYAITQNPGNDHRALLLPVMHAQARIAAAIAVFQATKSNNNHPPPIGSQVVIHKDAMQQATHVMENECRDYATRILARKIDESGFMVSIYCS